MNVERLFTISNAIVDDINKTGVINLLNQISQSLNHIMTQQNNGTHRRQLTTFLDHLREKCNSSALNNFPPLWKQTTLELGFELIGNELYEKVNEQVQKHQLTIPEGKK